MENLRSSEDLLRDSWESLGIAFVVNASGTRHADPERTLLQTLREFEDQRKMLRLVLAWLRSYGALVHVERIKALAGDLPAGQLAWLGGLAEHQTQQGDLRWRSISQMIKHILGTPAPRFEMPKLDTLQVARKGEDLHFKEFGLVIPTVEPAEPKKLYSFNAGVRNNIWLRMRILFGTNWRADAATVMILGLAKNPYQAEQILGCAKETAYRNWRALKEADVEQLLRGMAA